MSRENFQQLQEDNRENAGRVDRLLPGGLFIIFEGIDGTGKSTQLNLLAEKLTELGYDVVSTREPTNSQYGQRIRELYVDRTAVTHEEELELFIADRKQHVEEVIAPALARGAIVICDRYYLSTVAYQGARGMHPLEILAKNKKFPVPDLAIILELDPAQGIRRIMNQRNEHPNTFEKEKDLRKVAAIFAAMEQSYITRINASDSIENVHRRVFEAVRKVLQRKTSSALQG
ncbi:MAG: dTMP kinase [Desulfobulbales bacterium]|nr:dTMP kinase [Desulfobulbales bacterium]